MLITYLSHPFFSSKRGEQAGIALIAVLSLVILLSLAKTYLSIRNPSAKVVSAPAFTFASVQNIADWHLFGQASDEKDIPLTTLDLQLLAIFYAPDQQATVVISNGGQPARLYKIGDDLPLGATLVKILRYSLLLNNNGRIERLPLPIKKLQLQKPS